MKIHLALLPCLAGLACTTAWAADSADGSKAQLELRAACAQSYASFSAHYPAPAGNSPEYRGEKYPGDTQLYRDAKPCSEEHLAAYLDKADPALVMRAYPSAAGRPKAKKPATAASTPRP